MIPLRDTVRSKITPLATWAIIFLNTLVFLYEINLRPSALGRFTLAFGMVPANLHLSNPIVWLNNPWPLLTIVTSMFIHGGWFHFLSNMWVFFIFGDNVEDRLGSGRFLLFYLASGVVANVLQALVFPTSRIPAIGASGAIAGVLGAYFLFFPTARVVTLIPILFIPWIVNIPAIFYLGFWFISQLYSGLFSLSAVGASAGGVAWWAHIGGFIFGVLYARLGAPRPRVYVPRYPDDSISGNKTLPWD